MENAEVALTGMWGGESSSQRNEPTTWTETILKFERNTDDTFGLNTTTGRITGHGLSCDIKKLLRWYSQYYQNNQSVINGTRFLQHPFNVPV